MRALIVGSWVASGCEALLRELARDVGVVVAADGGAAACLAAGVTPTVVVGDMDSLDVEPRRLLRGLGVPFVTASAEKDVTDLDLAVDYARNLGVHELLATGVLGGRLDQTLATLGTLSRASELRPCVREAALSAWILAPDGRPEVLVPGRGSALSIVALGTRAVVTAAGVKYPLDGDVLESLSSRGISNEVTADEARVVIRDGVVAVMSEGHLREK